MRLRPVPVMMTLNKRPPGNERTGATRGLHSTPCQSLPCFGLANRLLDEGEDCRRHSDMDAGDRQLSQILV